MAKYKPYNPAQGRFLPVFFNKQLQKGTFEYSVNYLIDHEINLSELDSRYQNDENGAPAYDPRILLKVVLLTYSRGITSSRKLPNVVREILFSWLFLPIANHISQPSQILSPIWIKR